MSGRLLIVDDEQSLLDFLSVLAGQEGFEVRTAASVEAARQALAAWTPDLVLCDLLMPDGSGLDLLRETRASGSPVPFLVMTAYTSTQSAIEAMKLGAYDYVSKPFDVEELKATLSRALEKTRLYEENVYLKHELQQRFGASNIIGRSSRMRAIFNLIEKVARTPSTVLIQGESGTGKELIARAIHLASPRANCRFLSINCGALPETLLESELFGHERGSFTGAVRDRRGLLLEAHRGTLFLDEISEMSLAMQVKLLRALQEKTVRRLGGTEEEAFDVRIIAATNKNLKEKIARGEFREDLFYRIHVIPVELPPLRERREDIPLLVDHFLRRFSEQLGTPPKRIAAEAMRLLEGYSWPGNVRELENLIERAVALSTSPVVTVADFPDYLTSGRGDSLRGPELPPEGLDLEAHLDRLRTEFMRQALERTDGRPTQAAQLLGMSFRSFRYYAKKAGLTGSRS